MSNIIINPQEAKDIVYGDEIEKFDYEEIKRQIIGSSRWIIHYRMVIKVEDKFYEINWEEGATEMQSQMPFDYVAEVELHQVFPKKKTITVYESED